MRRRGLLLFALTYLTCETTAGQSDYSISCNRNPAYGDYNGSKKGGGGWGEQS